MIEIKFPCQHCSQNIACDETISGTSVPCPACQKTVTVPDAREWQAIPMCDVFIIERGEGASGEHLARLVRDSLRQCNFDVFDGAEIKSSASSLTNLKRIELATDIIVIFSSGCFDGCRSEDDRVRQEIRHAIRKGKNIVPVLNRNFTPPNDLPADIAEVLHYHGITPVSHLWEESINRLIADSLKSKSRALASRSRLELSRARPLAMFAGVVAALGILIAIACLPKLHQLSLYPRYANLFTVGRVTLASATVLNVVILIGAGLVYALKEVGLKLLNSAASGLMLSNTACSVAYIVAARACGLVYLNAAGPPVLLWIITVVPLALVTKRAGKLLRKSSSEN